MRIEKVVFAIIIVVLPAVAFAEVSDKFPTVAENWLKAMPVGAIVFFGGYFRWWVGALLGVAPLLMLWGAVYLMLIDLIGAGLINEQGAAYPISMFGPGVIASILCGVGIWCGLRRRQKCKVPNAA